MNNWDKYYIDLCKTVATNSKCLSRKIGCIIVQDKSIISTGYNGPPRGVPSCSTRYSHDNVYKIKLENFLQENITKHIQRTPETENYLKQTCPRYVLEYKSGEGLSLCIAGHAERNALINAARHGIAVKGASLYLDTGIPCKDCIIEILNAGISEIVCTKLEYYDEMSKYLRKHSDIKIRKADIE